MDQNLAMGEPKRMTIGWRLFFCAFFYGPALWAALHGDYVFASICVATGLAAFSGFRAGAFYIFALLAGFAAAVAFAADLGRSQELLISQWFGTTGLGNRILSIAVVGILITILCSTFLVVVGKRLIGERRRLDSMNRWIGFGVGALEGLAATVFFLGGMLVMEPIEQDRAAHRDPDDARGLVVSKLVLAAAKQTRTSSVGPIVEAYNPFVRIPRLNKVEEVQKSVQVLSDPKKIEGLLDHPSLRELQQRPDVQRVVNKIRSDPEIQDVLNSGRPMDRRMAMKLINHPAILELIDQPGFVEQAAKIMQSW